MFKNKLGENSPIPQFIHLNIRHRDGIESLMTLEEGEFKVPIDDCTNCQQKTNSLQQVIHWITIFLHQRTKFDIHRKGNEKKIYIFCRPTDLPPSKMGRSGLSVFCYRYQKRP